MDTDPPGPLAPPGPEPWLRSDAVLARRVVRPLQRFLRVEAASGAVLLVATVVAVLWANSGWRAGYATVFHTELGLRVGAHVLRGDLTHWINDALMAVFFLVVGMEIKAELVTGELQDRRAAVLPFLAAVGGMVVPALIYAAVNAGGPGRHGWGIPMATDIAFALGVLALLGRRVPVPLKVFLLTLAVVDDIGAILVIAASYSHDLSWPWLVAAVGVVAVVVAARRQRVRYLPTYLVLGVALWWCCYRSGIHATIAGVVMGLLTPARRLLPRVGPAHLADRLPEPADRSAGEARHLAFLVRESVAPTERLTHALHPWSAFVIVPLFALANAGVEVSASALTSPAATSVGVVVGLVAGKVLGISLFSWLAVRFGLGVLPVGVRWVQVVGVAALGGIGFTVSLFVAGLAFPDHPALAADAKVGVLVASVAAALIGSTVLGVAGRAGPVRPGDVPAGGPSDATAGG